MRAQLREPWYRRRGQVKRSDPLRAASRLSYLVTTVLFHQRINVGMPEKLVRSCQRQLFDIFGQRVNL
jgi:hypothetical protein